MNANRFRADANYWDRKLANYLHDPPDKSIHIPGHEARSESLLYALGELPTPDKEFYQRADQIASGMDRTNLPGYSKDSSKNGAVDFLKDPILTHPTGEGSPLSLEIEKKIDGKEITAKMLEIINNDFGQKPGSQGLSEQFRNNPTGFSSARFHYVHHVLRERLVTKNVGGLGGVWHRIPADTRIPDHSIWQHCALVSALTSCFELSKEKRASLLVLNITPVQDFIGRARKLRDFWTGSLILSWLAFEGIRHVIYALGSDHVVYPSLIGQPMINWLLAKECGLSWLDGEDRTNQLHGVASLPNKFVCLVPTGQEAQFADGIKNSIISSWVQLGEKTLDLVESWTSRSDQYLSKQFQRQMENYWNIHWTACPLLDETAKDSIPQLLHRDIWQKSFEFMEDSRKLSYTTKGEGAFYVITHALAQGFLAAGKTHRFDHGVEEPGIKCSLHGDLEALRFSWENRDDRNPRPAFDPLWSQLKSHWKYESDFKPSERLSAVALVKRLAYYVCREMPEHPLKPFFFNAEGFPSTTEMALTDWLDTVERMGFARELGGVWRKKLAQHFHDQEIKEVEITEITKNDRDKCQKVFFQMEKAKEPVRDNDKYYAILLMDGDHMGRLVNGETLASTWKTVIHPDLVSRLENANFAKEYYDFWQIKLNQARLLAPSVHYAISEALGDFSLYLVPRIINKYRGRLIYAGGDDVCAILPVSTVVQAAREIAEGYSLEFLFYPDNNLNSMHSLVKSWSPQSGRLTMHLGKGQRISISAGILIAHHKKPLSVAIRRAHELLNISKNKGGRNALALELEKRSGGGRMFMAKWNEKPFDELKVEISDSANQPNNLLDHFLSLGKAMNKASKKTLTSSLAYRLEQFRPGLEAIVREAPEQLVKFLAEQVGRSEKNNSEEIYGTARQLAALIARKRIGNDTAELDVDALLIARFFGERLARVEKNQGDMS